MKRGWKRDLDMGSNAGNRKVAKNRGVEWKANLKRGRLDAELNPTKLKIYRIKANFSQSDMAEILCVSLSTYGAIERGKRFIKPKMVKEIAEVLELAPKTIFAKTKDKKFIAAPIKKP